MSFFKKFADGLTEDLSRLGLGPDKKENKDEASSSTRDAYAPQGYGQHQPPPQSQGGYYPPPQHQPYTPPPPQGETTYAYPPAPGPRPPPPYTPPADKPPIPAGWTPRWDDHHQRWYCGLPSFCISLKP